LFAERARLTPDSTAVVFEAGQLSYRELDRRTSLLAAHLQSLGVQADAPVAVFMERSVELAVALLSVLKAGGAYVPLDPAYPKERLEFMLDDVRPPVLLSQSHLTASLPRSDAATLCVDGDWEKSEKQDNRNIIGRAPVRGLRCGVDGEGLAYVIYTSGSTGKPKGAMNTHAAICNRLLWMQEAYELNSADRVLQKTPYSFHLSVS